MNTEVHNPLLKSLDEIFSKSTKGDLENNYLKKVKSVKKWTCYSDYCFDDKQKPNDVVCFTLIPYIDHFVGLSEYIKSIASSDIKKTRKIADKFTEFLSQYPLVNFSFILNERSRLLGENNDTVKSFLKRTFEFIKQQYTFWEIDQPEQRDHYSSVKKKIDCCIRLIDNNKKIKQINDMLLVSFFGAYVSSQIIKDNDIEIFGWFSDRDSLNEVCDNFSINLFHYYLHGLTNAKNFDFVASPAGSQANAFYEELVRIPDYVAGTLADYNSETNHISKDKFDSMLTNYMAENVHNNFIFKLLSDGENIFSTRVTLHKLTE